MHKYKLRFYNIMSRKPKLVDKIVFDADDDKEAMFLAPSLDLARDAESDLAVLFDEDEKVLRTIKFSPGRMLLYD